MQTFLPYSSFKRSASVLDRQRLGKQRVETMQIMSVLSGSGTAWLNHPAARMWTGFECWLMSYQFAVCLEKTLAIHRESEMCELDPPPPLWLGEKAFHDAHKSNLVRKNPDHYRQFFPTIPDDLPYIWPSSKEVHA